MGSKKIRPVTPGMRGQVATDFKDITKKKPEKSLLESKKSSGGRNNKGRITSCLLYTSPNPRDVEESRMPSSA